MDPMPRSSSSSETAEDRRRSARYVTDCPVEVVFDLTRLEGRAQNVSSDGISFFAHRALTVRIHVGGEEKTELVGKIVRMESVDEQRMAIAIRFDEPANLEDLGIGG